MKPHYTWNSRDIADHTYSSGTWAHQSRKIKPIEPQRKSAAWLAIVGACLIAAYLFSAALNAAQNIKHPECPTHLC